MSASPAAYLGHMAFLALDSSQMNVFYRSGVWLKFLIVVVGIPFFVGFICVVVYFIAVAREQSGKGTTPAQKDRGCSS